MMTRTIRLKMISKLKKSPPESFKPKTPNYTVKILLQRRRNNK